MQRKARRQAGHNPWHGSHSRRSSITSQGKSRPLMATDETLGGDHSTVSCGKSSMRRQYAPSSPSAAALRSEAREVLCSLQPAIHRRRERRSTFSSAHVSAAGDRKLYHTTIVTRGSLSETMVQQKREDLSSSIKHWKI
ncbi:hypothetical protein GW17_00002332 [Ensete ventricosum]|nr:hypothetical protein GW17_00002332 [Ensete ventricosum]